MPKGVDTRAVYSVITNSTYDGLCYNARRVEELLDPSVDRIHFDEAWYAYARFNPLYRDRHAMHGDPQGSQGSDGLRHALDAQAAGRAVAGVAPAHPRRPQPDSAFALQRVVHAACVDVAAVSDHRLERHHGRDDGRTGRPDADQRIDPGGRRVPPDDGPRAPASSRQKREWFFRTWNADNRQDRKSGKKVRFEDAPPEWLATDPDCWVLHPGETWHGFGDLEDDYCMLDPIKVSIVTPGVADKGGLDKRGIPASSGHAYLHYRGVEVEKTTDFTILVLFSIGITKGKWGTLLNALLEFKRDYDNNAPLAQVLPRPRRPNHPSVYGGLGLRELADQMFAQLRDSRQTHWLAEAFSTLPDAGR